MCDAMVVVRLAPAQLGRMQKTGWKHRRHLFLLPNVSIQHAEVGGFVEVVVADFGSGFQVGDGAGEAEDLVVGPS